MQVYVMHQYAILIFCSKSCARYWHLLRWQYTEVLLYIIIYCWSFQWSNNVKIVSLKHNQEWINPGLACYRILYTVDDFTSMPYTFLVYDLSLSCMVVSLCWIHMHPKCCNRSWNHIFPQKRILLIRYFQSYLKQIAVLYDQNHIR